MNPHINSPRPATGRLLTPVGIPGGPRMNALKHGLRGATVLQPGDDVDEFQRMRQEMFDLHKPRTGNEARCVEAMADHEWVMGRCRQVRSLYHGKLLALLSGGPDGAEGVHCERDPHRWHHSAMDCALEEGRVGKLQDRERRKLAELQKLRRQNSIAGAVEAEEREQVVQPRGIAAPSQFAAPGQGKAEMPGAELLGAYGKPSALARPTAPEQGKTVAKTAEAPANPSHPQANRKIRDRTGTPPQMVAAASTEEGSHENEDRRAGENPEPKPPAMDGEVLHESGAILMQALGDPEGLALATEPPPGLTAFDRERWWAAKRNPARELARHRGRLQERIAFLRALPERERTGHREELAVLLRQA